VAFLTPIFLENPTQAMHRETIVIEAKGFVRDPNTGEEKKIEFTFNLPSDINRALGVAATKEFIRIAIQSGFEPLRIDEMSAISTMKWTPDSFDDTQRELAKQRVIKSMNNGVPKVADKSLFASK
jgi:hypothetical protein